MTRAYWWRKETNWGDRLNWTILDKLNADPVWEHPLEAELVLMGSIIEHIPPVWTGTICGAGKMFEDSRPDLSRAKVLAVRGKLTAEGCRGIPQDVALGDPALLAPLWFRQRPAIHELGIIPHWTDTE